jgi:predicted RNase H-like HicB family nuclease
MRFLVRIYKYGGNYSAMVPVLPGCVTVAKTVEQIRKLMAEAITGHLELMQESGEKIPSPTQHIDFVIDETVEEELCTWVEAKTPQPVSQRSQK